MKSSNAPQQPKTWFGLSEQEFDYINELVDKMYYVMIGHCGFEVMPLSSLQRFCSGLSEEDIHKWLSADDEFLEEFAIDNWDKIFPPICNRTLTLQELI